MASKFLNIKLSDGSVSPLRISDVASMKFAADVGNGGTTLQTDFRITYTDGAVVKILSQVRGGAGAQYVPSAAGQKTEFVRAMWQQIIAAVATPWNQPVIGGENGWDYTAEPSSPQASEYVPQSNAAGTVGGGGDSLEAKVSTMLLGTNAASTPTTGPMSPMLSIEAV